MELNSFIQEEIEKRFEDVCKKFKIVFNKNFFDEYVIEKKDIVLLFENDDKIPNSFIMESDEDMSGIFYNLMGLWYYRQKDYLNSYIYYQKSISLGCIFSVYNLCCYDFMKNDTIFILSEGEKHKYYEKISNYLRTNENEILYGIYPIYALFLYKKDRNIYHLKIERLLLKGIKVKNAKSFFAFIYIKLKNPFSKNLSHVNFIFTKAKKEMIFINIDNDFERKHNEIIECLNLSRISNKNHFNSLVMEICEFFKRYS